MPAGLACNCWWAGRSSGGGSQSRPCAVREPSVAVLPAPRPRVRVLPESTSCAAGVRPAAFRGAGVQRHRRAWLLPGKAAVRRPGRRRASPPPCPSCSTLSCAVRGSYRSPPPALRRWLRVPRCRRGTCRSCTRRDPCFVPRSCIRRRVGICRGPRRCDTVCGR